MNGRIIKADLNRDFFSMRNHAFKNNSLSFKAKGILGFMMQCPPGWEFTIAGLAACAKDGPDSVKTGLQELKKFLYLYYVTISRGGKIAENQYHISDTPFNTDYLKETFPDCKIVNVKNSGNIHVTISGSGFSASGKTASAKSRQLNIEGIKHLSNPSIIGAEFENLDLPTEEKIILTAIQKANEYFVEWSAMKDSLVEGARIPPDHPTFNFDEEVEKWIRHHSDKIVWMQDPGSYIPKSFSSWLKKFIQYNPVKNETGNSKPSTIIDEQQFNSAASSLFSKGY